LDSSVGQHYCTGFGRCLQCALSRVLQSQHLVDTQHLCIFGDLPGVVAAWSQQTLALFPYSRWTSSRGRSFSFVFGCRLARHSLVLSVVIAYGWCATSACSPRGRFGVYHTSDFLGGASSAGFACSTLDHPPWAISTGYETGLIGASQRGDCVFSGIPVATASLAEYCRHLKDAEIAAGGAWKARIVFVSRGRGGRDVSRPYGAGDARTGGGGIAAGLNRAAMNVMSTDVDPLGQGKWKEVVSAQTPFNDCGTSNFRIQTALTIISLEPKQERQDGIRTAN